jgi:carnosine N-methyltransferase
MPTDHPPAPLGGTGDNHADPHQQRAASTPADQTNTNPDTDDDAAPLASRLSPAALALERASLERILRAFRGYRAALELEVQRWERNLEALRDPRHAQLLAPIVRSKCQGARRAGDANQQFLDAMLEAFEAQGGVDGVLGVETGVAEEARAGEGPTGGGGSGGAGCSGHTHDDHPHHHHHSHDHSHDDPDYVSAEDVDKVRYVLKNVARDWSEEGAAEREASYGRIVAELRRLFCLDDDPRQRLRRTPAVLVPGAGLARLCVDVAAAGMRAQGNEFSYYMLVASAFILNGSPEPGCRLVHPWCHAALNQLSAAGQLRAVSAPDACPQDLLAAGGWGDEDEKEDEESEEEEQELGEQGAAAAGGAGGGAGSDARASRPRPPRRPPLPPLSMCAGDFEEVYGSPGMRARFDAVATCFFLDTARNVVRYLEVVWHALKPGGYWVHLGPLLWHWGGASGERRRGGGAGEEGGGGDDADQQQQQGDDVSIELALDEVAQVARALGFVEIRSELVRAPYMGE